MNKASSHLAERPTEETPPSPLPGALAHQPSCKRHKWGEGCKGSLTTEARQEEPADLTNTASSKGIRAMDSVMASYAVSSVPPSAHGTKSVMNAHEKKGTAPQVPAGGSSGDSAPGETYLPIIAAYHQDSPGASGSPTTPKNCRDPISESRETDKNSPTLVYGSALHALEEEIDAAWEVELYQPLN
jgi:hypothetical protein